MCKPDITEKGDSGLVALHIAFRAHPTNGEASVTPEMLAKLADSYDDYFNHWAKTNSDRSSESGINAEKVDEGRQHKAKLRGAFEIVGMVPPNESPTEMDFARDVPEIARAVAENFNILGFEDLDYNDPSVRDAVANAANFTFEYEKVWAEKFDLSKDDVHNWSSGFSSTFFQMEMADKKSSPSVAMSTQPTSS